MTSRFVRFGKYLVDLSATVHRGTSIITEVVSKQEKLLLKAISHQAVDQLLRLPPIRLMKELENWCQRQEYSVRVLKWQMVGEDMLMVVRREGSSLSDLLRANRLARDWSVLSRFIEIVDHFLRGGMPVKNFGPEVILVSSEQNDIVVNTVSSKFVTLKHYDQELRQSIARTLYCLVTLTYVSNDTAITAAMLDKLQFRQVAFLIDSLLNNSGYNIKNGVKPLLVSRPPCVDGVDSKLLNRNKLDQALLPFLKATFHDNLENQAKVFGLERQLVARLYVEIIFIYVRPKLMKTITKSTDTVSDSLLDKTKTSIGSDLTASTLGSIKIKGGALLINKEIEAKLKERIAIEFKHTARLKGLDFETKVFQFARRLYERLIKPALKYDPPKDLALSYNWLLRCCESVPDWLE